jgi:hypothetical protein
MSDEIKKIGVYKLLGNHWCSVPSDAHKLHDILADAIWAGQTVDMSFADITILPSSFLNIAIGQLYGEFSADEIKRRIVVSEMKPEDMATLKLVVENAKAYFAFKNAKAYLSKRYATTH